MTSPWPTCKHGEDPTTCDDCTSLANALHRAEVAESERDAEIKLHEITRGVAREIGAERDRLRAVIETFIDLWERTTATRSVRALAVDQLRAALRPDRSSDDPGRRSTNNPAEVAAGADGSAPGRSDVVGGSDER